MNEPFDPQTLAADLCEVRRIYANFFSALTDADWDRPVKGGPNEWNLHQTVAHLCALSGAGLESIQAVLRGETYVFAGLEDRYQFKAYNLRGIEAHLSLSRAELCARFLSILDQAADIARGLLPGQAEQDSVMPIYNRPVKTVEALAIIMFHAGLHHSAQVTEPAGVPPLWMQLSPEIRRRVIGRVLNAFSLLYRYDLGGELRAVIVFRVDGPGGGVWHIDLTPTSAASDEGSPVRPTLTVHLRETGVFCRMLTSRMNLPLSLLGGQIKLSGDLRLFPRMGSLFSVDATH